jgi:hypothetical protein
VYFFIFLFYSGYDGEGIDWPMVKILKRRRIQTSMPISVMENHDSDPSDDEQPIPDARR